MASDDSSNNWNRERRNSSKRSREVRQKKQKLLSRRTFTGGTATFALAGLAGCIGGDSAEDDSAGDDSAGDDSGGDDSGGDDSTGDDSEPVENVDVWLDAKIDQVPTDAQWFEPGPANWPGDAQRFLCDGLAYINENDGEVYPQMAEDWAKDGQQITVNLKEGYHWGDGDPCVADDWVAQWRVEDYLDYRKWGFFDSVEAADDYTIDITLSEDYSLSLIEQGIFGSRWNGWLLGKADVYGQWNEQLEDASSTDEEDEILADMLDFELEEPQTNGPWRVTEQASSHMLCETVEDDMHPHASEINFNGVRFNLLESGQAVAQATISGKLDNVQALEATSDVHNNITDLGTYYQDTSQTHAGPGLLFNHNKEPLGDRRFRQALAHIIDRELIAENLPGPNFIAAPKPTNLTGANSGLLEEILGDRYDDYNSYDSTEEAERLLEEVGASKDGDEWVDENGEPFNFEVKAPAGRTEYETSQQTIASQLDQFGIGAEARSVDGTVYWNDYSDGNFDLAFVFTPAGHPFPYFHFADMFGAGASYYDPFGWGDGSDNPCFDTPPIGDPEGSTRELCPIEMVEELRGVDSEEREQELTLELAWMANWHLPALHLVEKWDIHYVKDEGWNIPGPDDDAWNEASGQGYHQLPKTGRQTAQEGATE